MDGTFSCHELGEAMEKNKRKIIVGMLLFVLLLGIFVAASIQMDASVCLTLAFAMWIGLMVYSVMNLNRHIVLFCYLTAFFVFLFGREIGYTFFRMERYYWYLEPYNEVCFFLLLISLVFLLLGYGYAGRKSHVVLSTANRYAQGYRTKELPRESGMYQFLCRWAYYLCYFCAIYVVFVQIAFVQSSGYLASYLGGREEGMLFRMASYLSAFAGTALCLFLATYPSKRSVIIALASYEIYGVFTVFTGHRYTFIAISMLVAIYMFIRNRVEGGWITRKHVIMVLVALPFLVIIMTAYDTIRLGEGFRFNGFGKTILEFLDQQGGSVNMIKRIFYYKEELSDMNFVSFHNTKSVLFENAILRKMLDINVYNGNSIENALYGHSLAHRLSYLEYGDYYLQGHGVGSCYIAELYHDFGVIGVMAGNYFYGYIIRKISDISFRNFVKDGLLLALVYYILLAPRGNFDGFVEGVFSIYSVLGLLFIWLVSNLFTKKNKYTIHSQVLKKDIVLLKSSR